MLSVFTLPLSGADKIEVTHAIGQCSSILQCIHENQDQAQWVEIEKKLQDVQSGKLWINNYTRHSEKIFERVFFTVCWQQ